MAKSAKKSESIPYVTPWFIARYPKISDPDVKGKFADGKFKTDGVFESDETLNQVEKTLREAAKKFWPDVADEDLRLPVKDFFSGKGEDKKPDGRGIVLKSQYRPAVFDAKKKKLAEGVKIGGGSEIRVASSIFPWSKTETETVVENGVKSKRQVTAYGVGLRLGDTQVRKLVVSQGQGDGSAFDEVEGFEYEGDEGDGEQFNDDATAL